MMPAKILHYRTRKTGHEVHTCRKQLPLTVKVSPMNHGNLRILTNISQLGTILQRMRRRDICILCRIALSKTL